MNILGKFVFLLMSLTNEFAMELKLQSKKILKYNEQIFGVTRHKNNWNIKIRSLMKQKVQVQKALSNVRSTFFNVRLRPVKKRRFKFSNK